MSKKQDRAAYMRGYRQQKKQNDSESTKALAEIEASYRKHRKRIEDAMEQASPGTQVWLRYAEALAKLDQQRREELVRRGFSPENLQVGTTPAFIFTARIDSNGGVFVSRSKAEDEERARIVAELEEEFPSNEPIVRKQEE